MLRIVSLCCLLACASVAQAGVISSSSLSVTGFTISTSSVPRFDFQGITSVGQVKTDLDGNVDSSGTGLPGTANASSFGVGSALANVSGIGNALAGGINVNTASAVDLMPGEFLADGTANANLVVDFGIIGGGSILVSVNFAAVSTLATVPGPGGTTVGGFTNFSIGLFANGDLSNNLLEDLNDDAQVLSQTSVGVNNFNVVGQTTGYNRIRVFAGNTYQFVVTQSSGATATSVVPEPATMFAFGMIAFGGVAAGRRKRAIAKNA